jgi:hypothetical protein
MRVLSCLVLLVVVSLSRANHPVQVWINKECYRLNRTGVGCVYNSLTILSRHHGVSKGFRLDEQYVGPAPNQLGYIAGILDRHGVPFVETPHNPTNRNFDFLRKWVTHRRLGVLVGFQMRHAVVCCSFDEANETVDILDNAGPYAGVIYRHPMSWFLQRWDGWAVAVLPEPRVMPQATNHYLVEDTDAP